MKEYTDKAAIIIAGLGLSVAVYSLIDAIKTHKEEKEKRRINQEEHLLDLDAIQKASEVMTKRLMNGYYDYNLLSAIDDMDTEIEFQKIAIRENR